jgi:hypothetical protein
MALLGRQAKYAIPQLVEISQEEVAGTYTIAGGRHTEYATEILELLKQLGEEVRQDVAKATRKGGPKAATRAGGNFDGTQNAGPTRRSTE